VEKDLGDLAINNARSKVEGKIFEPITKPVEKLVSGLVSAKVKSEMFRELGKLKIKSIGIANSVSSFLGKISGHIAENKTGDLIDRSILNPTTSSEGSEQSNQESGKSSPDGAIDLGTIVVTGNSQTQETDK
jgi:hypothetical protein